MKSKKAEHTRRINGDNLRKWLAAREASVVEFMRSNEALLIEYETNLFLNSGRGKIDDIIRMCLGILAEYKKGDRLPCGWNVEELDKLNREELEWHMWYSHKWAAEHIYDEFVNPISDVRKYDVIDESDTPLVKYLKQTHSDLCQLILEDKDCIDPGSCFEDLNLIHDREFRGRMERYYAHLQDLQSVRNQIRELEQDIEELSKDTCKWLKKNFEGAIPDAAFTVIQKTQEDLEPQPMIEGEIGEPLTRGEFREFKAAQQASMMKLLSSAVKDPNAFKQEVGDGAQFFDRNTFASLSADQKQEVVDQLLPDDVIKYMPDQYFSYKTLLSCSTNDKVFYRMTLFSVDMERIHSVGVNEFIMDGCGRVLGGREEGISSVYMYAGYYGRFIMPNGVKANERTMPNLTPSERTAYNKWSDYFTCEFMDLVKKISKDSQFHVQETKYFGFVTTKPKENFRAIIKSLPDTGRIGVTLGRYDPERNRTDIINFHNMRLEENFFIKIGKAAKMLPDVLRLWLKKEMPK
jgi:hypothetical protein